MGLRHGAAVVVILVVLVPSAGAQPPVAPAVEFVAETPAERLSAEAGARATPVRLAFSCSVDELVMAPNTQIAVQFATGTVPPFAILNLDPGSTTAAPTDAAHCTDAMMRHYVNATASLFVQTSAPALVEHRIPLRATLTFENVNDTDTMRGPFATNLTFVPAYVSSFEVEADRYNAMATGANRSARFQINVTNRANAASVATFEIQGAGGLVVTLPEPLPLPYPSAGAQVTAITLAIPDAVYQSFAAHTVTVLVKVASSDSSANSTSESSLVLTVQGPPKVKKSPGPEFVVAAALLAVIAFWLRRDRQAL